VYWRIQPIAQCPHVIDLLARWHHAEWGALMAPWSLQEAADELHQHAQSGSFPTTLVAHDAQSRLAGSVSLVAVDAPEFREHSPWLSSLFVAPPFRGAGLGSALIAALGKHAAGLGIARMHLFTPGSPAIYERAGWMRTEDRTLGGRQVTLMQLVIPVTSA
jgi:GNAT superfamily N-acetyltransferase